MKTLMLVCASALVLAGCTDAVAPTPLRPLAPWDYVLTELNGEAVPTGMVLSGHLILHADSTYFDVVQLTDSSYEGFNGRFSINAREDSITFTPSARSGIQPYAAAISRDSIRVVIPGLGLSRLFKEE